MCYAPFQIWLPQLLRYGGVGRPASTARRTALLKELDPGSNPAERGWSHLWCLRAAHAGEPFSLRRFAEERSTAAAGGGQVLCLRRTRLDVSRCVLVMRLHLPPSFWCLRKDLGKFERLTS